MQIHKLPSLLETYFVEESKTIPTAAWGKVTDGEGFLGPDLKRLTGSGVMAGWALPVTCPDDNVMATYLALQYMLDTTPQGRWVMVVTPEAGSDPTNAALWNYMQSAMAWEVGFVGAVVAGYTRDIDEIKEKLKSEFSVFAYGPTPVPATAGLGGSVGVPVTINNVSIRAGDLIVGDSDGLLVMPKDQVADGVQKTQAMIVEEVNLMQHVREGMGAVDVLKLRDELKGNVDVVE